MSTISGNLALLQRTKAGQRALLEEMYPDMDFSTVPFREYGRLFTGRKYVPGFVGGWKAYGRSNSEDASTRDILPDYSGNGRDIRLYNFGFSGMSGYGGYSQENYNFSLNSNTNFTIENTGTKTIVRKSDGDSIGSRALVVYKDISTNWNLGVVNKVKAGDYGVVVWKTKNGGKEPEVLCEVAPGKTGTFVNEQADIDAGFTLIKTGPQIAVPAGQSFSVEFLPDYPGALVSDGVDDYGQCMKGFALPDDYTVVAVRKIITANNGGIASKGSVNGAFLFEAGSSNVACWSYGGPKAVDLKFRPALFSYQAKESYNGQEISAGTAVDSDEDKLFLFKQTVTSPDRQSAALYDLRIYDHSLTAEELQAVKDEMMADYEAATGGGITDITYVADWDAKGRSNDEEEPMRSQWIDKKTGKVINLSDFGFSGMSGWNGYEYDYTTWIKAAGTNYDLSVLTVSKTVVSVHGILSEGKLAAGVYINKVQNGETVHIYIRVSGLKPGQYVRIANEINQEGDSQITEDGETDLTLTNDGSRYGNVYILVYGAGELDVTIEQLPFYPGALVSDGVDDYGRTAETISEEVGTMLVYGDYLTINTQYLLSSGLATEDTWLYATQEDNNGVARVGKPDRKVTDTMPMASLTRDPASPNANMRLFNAGDRNYACAWLARLILIREQLDGAQIELLKWKVDKEHRDWLKEKGWAA